MESIPPKSIYSVRKVVLLTMCIGIILFLSGFSLQSTNAQETLNSQSGKEARLSSIQKGQKIKISKSEISDMLTGKEFNEKRVVVLFKENVSVEKAKSIAKKLNSEIPSHQAVSLKKVGETRYASLSVPKGLSVETFLQKLNESNDVVFAEPSYKRTLFWTPNDPNFAQQWQLQNYSTGNYGIEMPKAWDYVDTQLDAKIGAGNNYGGSSSVIVAILDTGLAFEDRTVLKASMLPTPPVNDTYEESWDFDPVPDKPVNIWVNTGEIAGNGIDDDTNGYIDDVNGVNIDDYYNYTSMYGGHTSEDGYPDDDYGHGTHVANIIAGNTNNTVASAGIAYGVTIMPIKIFNYLEGVWSESVIDGLAYAIENEADVINMSFGGSSASTVEEALINQAVSLGIIPVAASGNDGNTAVQYPGGYENVIAVGASNPNGTRSSYSSYGNWIDLVAPVGVTGSGNGFQVQNYTCYDEAVSSNALPCTEDNSDPQVWYPGTGTANSFKTFSVATSQGTSFAAPQVSAVAALLKSLDSNISFAQARYKIRMGATIIGGVRFNSTTGYGILNANETLKEIIPGNYSEIYRFWSDRYKHHFYTISSNERDNVIQNLWFDWTYEGTVFYASNIAAEGLSPIYRFWSPRYKGHFYTISAEEKDNVIQTLSHDWTYEGIAYYASPIFRPDLAPLHRFWSNRYKGHFYTMSESEKDYVITSLSHDWTYEGIAYYVSSDASPL